MALVIPTSREIKSLVDALDRINDTLTQTEATNQERLQIETEMLRLLRYDHFAADFVFTAKFEGQKPQKGITMLQLTDIQKCDLSIQIVDAKGNAAPVDGAPVWSSSDESVATVAAAADGMSAVVTAAGALGTCQVNVGADADLGTGVTTITGTLDVSVVASQATTVTINTGTPTNQ
jgi:hypothetical protein